MPEFKKLQKSCLSYFPNFSFPNTFFISSVILPSTDVLKLPLKLIYIPKILWLRVLFHWCAPQTMTMSELFELDCSGLKNCALWSTVSVVFYNAARDTRQIHITSCRKIYKIFIKFGNKHWKDMLFLMFLGGKFSPFLRKRYEFWWEDRLVILVVQPTIRQKLQ